MRSLPLVLVAATIAAGTLVTSAEAQRYRGYADDGYVTAESRYSGKAISAPVRYGRRGRAEVRLPGGTWIECGRSCSDTLRRETVDFWDSRQTPGGSDGPGYLRFRF